MASDYENESADTFSTVQYSTEVYVTRYCTCTVEAAVPPGGDTSVRQPIAKEWILHHGLKTLVPMQSSDRCSASCL